MVDLARLQANLESVKLAIKAACERAGRDQASVMLLAVTKTVSPGVIRALHGLGVKEYGENRAQRGAPLAKELAELDATWHFIGHLQRNKAKVVAESFSVIHSVDSLRLAEELSKETARLGKKLRILLEIKTSGEESKQGLAPQEAEALAKAAVSLPGLKISGLMTMAPLAASGEAARPYFKALRQLRDSIAAATGSNLPELSMGMSHDYEAAIEEGSTIVRVGSALFDGVE